MKLTNIVLFFFGAVGLSLAGSVNAQQVLQVSPGDIKIKKIEVEAQKTPEFQAGNVTNKRVDRPREWLELEAEFEADVKRAPNDAVLPELEFRSYVGIVDESGRTKKNVVLTGKFTHQNITVGEKYYAAAYVAPSTMAKLTGDRKVKTTSVKAHGVEVYYEGILVGLWSSTGTGDKAKFWNAPSMTRTDGGILSRDKTPFGILWIDRYPEIKSK